MFGPSTYIIDIIIYNISKLEEKYIKNQRY